MNTGTSISIVPQALLLVLALVSFTVKTHAQAKNYTLPQIVPKSPDVAQMEKYGEIPVSQSTGTTNVSINLATIEVGKFTLPINLRYQNNGLKVDEIASSIGEGWVLDAGGMVSFNQRGTNDFGPYGLMTMGTTNLTKFFSGTMTEFERSNYLDQVINDLQDGEYDLYHYSLPSGAGSFFFENPNKAVLMPKSDLQVKHLTNGIQINDNQGNRYYFNSIERSGISDPTQIEVRASFNDISAYKLTKVITAENRIIEFKYKSYSFNYSKTKYKIDHLNTLGAPSGCPISMVNTFDEHVEIEYLLPDSIIFDQGYVKFNQSPTYRQDIMLISSGAAIPSITGFQIGNSNGQKVKEFYFTQGYFDTNKRLKLTGITEQNNNVSARKWNFSYYNEMWAFPSFYDYSKDHWGYFNNAGNTSLIPEADYTKIAYLWKSYNITYANRQSNFSGALTGMLKEITYPTGGTTLFEYEPNQIKVRAYSDILNKSPFFKIDNASSYVPLAGGSTFDNTTGHVEGSFTLAEDKYVRMTAFVNYDPDFFEDPQLSFTGPKLDDIGKAVSMNYDYVTRTSGGEVFALLPAGTYTYSLTAGRTYDLNTNQYIPRHCQFYIYVETPNPAQPFIVGGCRIAKISTIENTSSHPNVVKRFIYSDSLDQVTFRNIPNYLSRQTSLVVNPNAQLTCYECGNLYTIHDESVVPAAGSHIEYAFVTEYDSSENKLLGKIENRFLTSQNIAGSYGQPFVAPVNTSWRGGLLANQKIYKGEDKDHFELVREINNEYTINSGLHMVNGIKLDYGAYCSASVGRIINQSLSTLFTEQYYLSKTVTTDYISPTQSISTVTNTTANSTFHNLPVTTSQLTSTEQVVTAKTLYSFDYDTTLVSNTIAKGIRNLKRLNILVPVEQLQIKSLNGIEYVTDGILTCYRDDKAVTGKVLQLKVATPIPLTQFVQSYINSGGDFIFDSLYEEKATFDSYDNYNNVTTCHLTGNLLMSYLWDYKNIYPIAKATNADGNDIAYTSFEADQKGNWQFSGTPVTDINAPTGNKYYNLSGGVSIDGLNTGKTYILTYWTPGPNAFTINGTQNGYPVKVKTLNGWSQFMHVISGISTINFPNNGLVDELRLCPADAQMETFTYDPMIGITSHCDEKGMITYYSYDPFGRLLLIRDQNGMIVRQFDYQYQKPFNN